MTMKTPSRLAMEMLETADDMRRVGAIDDAAHRKITLRHLSKDPAPASKPISGAEIRRMREDAHLSQAAFARHLNLTTGYVSQLEREAKQPKGPALALLNILRRKGVEVIL